MTGNDISINVLEDAEPAVVEFNGALDRSTVPEVFRRLRPLFNRKTPLVFDFGGVARMDSSGLALVAYGFRKLGTGIGGLSLRSIGGEVEKTLKLAGWNFSGAQSLTEDGHSSFAETAGAEAEKAASSIYYYLYLISETIYHSIVTPWKGEKPRFAIFVAQMARLGAGSAPIVWLIALLVGLTTAYQAAYQLRQFGANIYIADLVAISMMTELGPLMAAIMVAGRSGAAITAEIGTMQVNEEIDALRLIGMHPVQYLVVPKVYAVVITQALLGITSACVGILGGYVIAVSYLDLSSAAFINKAVNSLVMMDLVNNLTKSAIFGFIIVTVGSFYGLRVSGGAEGVGRATTNSVVTSIFLIIVTDCVYSLI